MEVTYTIDWYEAGLPCYATDHVTAPWPLTTGVVRGILDGLGADPITWNEATISIVDANTAIVDFTDGESVNIEG